MWILAVKINISLKNGIRLDLQQVGFLSTTALDVFQPPPVTSKK